MTTNHREPGTTPGSTPPRCTAETCAPVVKAAAGTVLEDVAALLMPYDGSPLTLDALERRAARRYTLAPAALRTHLARRALGLAKAAGEVLPTGNINERAAREIKPVLPRVVEATREPADGPPQLALW